MNVQGAGTPRERWAAAEAYERFMGRWSRPVARAFVESLAVAPSSRWLDLGCGTGSLTGAILALARPAAVTACDPSAEFVEHVRAHQRDPRVRAVVAGAADLPRIATDVDALVSCLVLNFLPEPGAAVRAMAAATSRGGVVAACVWDYAGEMEYLRTFWDAAAALDPAAAPLDEGVRFPLCRPQALSELFAAAGLREVRTSAVRIETRFEDFADYWTPFLGGVGPAGTYVGALPDGARSALAQALEARLPRAADGSIPLVARAWVVVGRPGRADSRPGDPE